jgi:hypothetical protein
MASNINITDIDAEYPVPGQDNDSQGFRDNFTTILSNFEEAKTEIETLQTNSVAVNVDSTFLTKEDNNPATLINANLKGHTEQYYTPPEGAVSVTQSVDFDNGSYQVFSLEGATEFSFTGWPLSGRLAKITMHLESSGSFAATFSGNVLYDDIASTFWGNPTIASGEVHIIDFWTYQGGTTIYAKHQGSYAA